MRKVMTYHARVCASSQTSLLLAPNNEADKHNCEDRQPALASMWISRVVEFKRLRQHPGASLSYGSLRGRDVEVVVTARNLWDIQMTWPHGTAGCFAPKIKFTLSRAYEL